MAKRRRLNFELVLVQGCSFNNKMGGVGLGFGLILGFNMTLLVTLALGKMAFLAIWPQG